MKNLKSMIKEKQFRLILREPGRGDMILAEGSEKFVAAERTKQSVKYNSDHLVIEEVSDEEEDDLGINLRGVIVSLVLSLVVLAVYGKKRK